MEKRKLGNSDLEVSVLGLGCMSLGTDGAKAEKIIEAAVDSGINYFDTADLYDFGENEKIVGRTLASKRDKVIIATKVGNRFNDTEEGWRWDPSKEYIKEAVKDSLKRLETDYIDLYQLHGGTIEDNFEETIEAFEELKEEGLIRYYGISSIRPNVIRPYAEKSSIVSNMMQYNMLDRRPEELFSFLEEHHVSVVSRGSVAKGLLSDKVLDRISAQVPEKGYLDYSRDELIELISSIQAELIHGGRTMNELSLQFILGHPAIACAVTGASSENQLLDNVRAANADPLSLDEMALIEKLTKRSKYEHHRD